MKVNYLIKLENGVKTFVADGEYGTLYVTSHPTPTKDRDLQYAMDTLSETEPSRYSDDTLALPNNIHRVSETSYAKETAEFSISLVVVDLEAMTIETKWTWDYEVDLNEATTKIVKPA